MNGCVHCSLTGQFYLSFCLGVRSAWRETVTPALSIHDPELALVLGAALVLPFMVVTSPVTTRGDEVWEETLLKTWRISWAMVRGAGLTLL